MRFCPVVERQQNVIQFGHLHQDETRDVTIFACDPVAGRKTRLIFNHPLDHMQLTAARLDPDQCLHGIAQRTQIDPSPETVYKSCLLQPTEPLSYGGARQANHLSDLREAQTTVRLENFYDLTICFVQGF